MEEIKYFFNNKEMFEKFRLLQATTEEKKKLRIVYAKVMRKNIRENCINCLHDAYVELSLFYKQDSKKFEALQNCDYELPNGVVLQIFGEPNKMMSAQNITNELAEYHLKKNPNCEKYFTKMPEKAEVKERAEQEKEVVDKMKAMLAEGISQNKIREHFRLPENGELKHELITELIKEANL